MRSDNENSKIIPIDIEERKILSHLSERLMFLWFGLAAARIRSRLSPQEVAMKVNIDPERYQRIEAGTLRPDFIETLRLASFFSIPLEKLILISDLDDHDIIHDPIPIDSPIIKILAQKYSV
jgi:DNA-binding XRE family transcriptional regulator